MPVRLQVTSFAEYLDHVQALLDGSWYFRGHSNPGFPLLASAARPDLVPPTGYNLRREKQLFQAFLWELGALSEFQYSPVEAMALSRHYGLPNRLLDWSENPLTAAFFAVDENYAAPGLVHAIRVVQRRVRRDVKDPFDPGLGSDPVIVSVPPRDHRLRAQQGVFSLHPRPAIIWDSPLDCPAIADYLTIPIPSSLKAGFAVSLSKLGFHRGRLMPGLDGLCGKLRNDYRWGI